MVFNLPATASIVFLEDDGAVSNGNLQLRSSNGTFDTTIFANPLGSLTIQRGNAADTITINALPDFSAGLTIGSAGGEFNTITFAGAVSLAAGKSLSVNAGGTISFPNATSDVATSGSGSVFLTTARNIGLLSGASISVVNGDMTLSANQQGVPTAGDFRGIFISGATITTTGTGNVNLFGNGGDDANTDFHIGVHIFDSLVQSTGAVAGAGKITITGHGGVGTEDNDGIVVEEPNARVLTANGDIQLTGIGGNGSTSFNHGIFVVDGGGVESTGTGPAAGNIALVGTGGLGTDSNRGAVVAGMNSRVTTVDGDIAITGQGNAQATGSTNFGVLVLSGGQVISTGIGASAGNITLTGAGGGTGESGSNQNQGVRIDSAESKVGSIDGNVNIAGTAGIAKLPSNTFSDGVRLTNSGQIEITGIGSLAVMGTAGTTIGSVGVALRLGGIVSLSGQSNTFVGDSMLLDPAALSIDAGVNVVVLRPKTAGTAINLGAVADTLANTLALSDAELDRITAGTIQIGDANSGSITISAVIDRAAGSTTAINLITGGNNSIAFSSSGSLDAKNGNVTLLTNSSGTGAITSGSASTAVFGANLGLTSGSGGIGTAGNPFHFTATNINATSGGNGNQFLASDNGPTAIDAGGLSAGAGTIELDGGNAFTLSASNLINDSTKLNVNGATFGIFTFNETVGGITLTLGSITGTTGILASASTIQTQTGTISVILAGAVGLTQSTTGTTTLSGANTYGGISTISAGTLRIGNGGSTGSLGAGNVVNNGTLVFNRTVNYPVSNVISGSGGVTISTGQVDFTGANIYTGTTLISGGSLLLGNSTTTGSLSPNSAIINNATFGSLRANTITQGVDFASVISGTGSVFDAGGGNLVLNGLNTYTGPTTIAGATLTFNSIKNVGGGASALGAPTLAGNGTIALGAQGAVISSRLVYSGTGDTTNRVVNLRDALGGGTILEQSGTGLLKFTSAFTATSANVKTLTLQGATSGTGEIAGAIVNNSSGNTTSLVKSGTGTWTLSGPSTYTGTTTVSAGTLLVNGSVTSNMTVNIGGTLGGTGTVNSANTVTINSGGHLAPGTSPGILNLGNLSLSSGASFDAELNGTSLTPTPQYDQLNVMGTVNLGGAALKITLANPVTTGSTFTIVNNDQSDGIIGTFNALPEGKVFAVTGTISGTFQITYQGGDGNDVILTALNAGNPALKSTPGDDTWLVKRNLANVELTLNGNLIWSTPYSNLTGVLAINGLAGIDMLTVDFSGGNVIPPAGLFFNAVTPTTNPSDRLIIIGGDQQLVVYGFDNAHDGRVFMSAFGTVTYTGVDAVLNTGSATDIFVSLPVGPSTITLGDDGITGNGLSRVSGPTIAQIDFANPTSSLTINRGNAADTLNIKALPAFTASLIIGSVFREFNSVDFNGAVNLLANHALTALAGTINISAPVSTSGGSITFNAMDGIALRDALTTNSGELEINADRDDDGHGTLMITGQPVGDLNVQTSLSAADGAASDVGAMADQGSAFVIVDTADGPGGSIATGSGSVTITAADADIQGPISSTNKVSLTSPLAFRPINLGTNTIGSFSLTDAELDQVTAGSIQIGSENSGPITISATISRPSATMMNLVSSQDIDFLTGSINTMGGDLTLAPGGFASVGVSKAGNDVSVGATGTLAFASGSPLAIAIIGKNVDTQYEQLNVAGKVNLTGVDLLLAGTYTPAIGDKFIVVSNDSNDAVTGEFNGLTEGKIFNPAAGPLNADFQITYHGGDGNDVVLTATNVAPTLDVIADRDPIAEDADLQTVNLSGITTGGTVTQNITVTATSDNPGLIPNPNVTYASSAAIGSISYKPVANQFGTAVITVTVQDDGGTDSGVDTFTRTFTVIVNPVNDAPSFAKGPDQTAATTPQSIPNWATVIIAGPPTATDEAEQKLSFTVTNDHNDLFDVQPAIDASGKLTFTPKSNVAGTARVMVVLMDDGGTSNGGVDTSTEQTFNIVTKLHVWHNDANRLDVTGEGGQPDGHIVAADALAIINYINAFGSGAVPANAPIGQPYGFLDTSGGIDGVGDDFIAPDDALAVINAINAGLGGEGESFATDMNAGSAGAINPQVYAGKPNDPTDLIALLALDMAQQTALRRYLRR